jgi:hypothetical protein
MKPKPPFQLPFWIMFGIFVVLNITDIATYEGWIRLKITHPKNTFHQYLWPLILFVETILYWVIRDRIGRRALVWLQLSVTFLSLSAVQSGIMVLLPTVSDPQSVDLIRKLGFSVCAIASVGYFWGVLLDAYREKKRQLAKQANAGTLPVFDKQQPGQKQAGNEKPATEADVEALLDDLINWHNEQKKKS